MSIVDGGFMEKILDWAWGIILALIAAMHHHHTETIKDIKVTLTGKASVEEMNRQRDNIAKIFDKMAQMEKDGYERFVTLLNAIHQSRITPP